MRLILLLIFLFPLYSEEYRGWTHLAEVLKRYDVSPQVISKYLNDERLPKFGFIPFKLKPTERHQDYSHFYKASLIQYAKTHLKAHSESYKKAYEAYGVSPEIIAAILLVETHFGQNTGQHRIFERLTRVCSIGEFNNIKENFKEHLKKKKNITILDTKNRAAYLENQFCPQLVALMKFDTDIMELRGSIAGAFGMPQFMPSSFVLYAIDFDSDKKIDLFSDTDAIGSVANFLVKHEYKKDKKQAVWGYNHSEAYNDTIFYVAKRLGFKE